MYGVMLGAVVVFIGMALGAGLQIFYEQTEQHLRRLQEKVEQTRQGGNTRRYTRQLVAFAFIAVMSFALVFVVTAAVPFGWGAVSLFLVDRLSLGLFSVIVGLVLFRLVRRAGRELQ